MMTMTEFWDLAKQMIGDSQESNTCTVFEVGRSLRGSADVGSYAPVGLYWLTLEREIQVDEGSMKEDSVFRGYTPEEVLAKLKGMLDAK